MLQLTKNFNKVEAIIAKTMEYLSIPCVVGHEDFFMNYLYADFGRLGSNVTKHKNVIAIHGQTPLSAIICVHIDRHGLISLENNQYAYAAQYVREKKYKEEHNSSRKELLNIAARFEGEKVYAYHPQTSLKIGSGLIESMENGDSRFRVWGIEKLPQNIPLAYARTAYVEDQKLIGQIDNALSVAVAYALVRKGFQGTVLLTTEEEIGKSWLHIADYLERQSISTQELLVLDTSPYPDEAPLDEGMLVLRNRDKSERFHAPLVQKLKSRCEKIDHHFQMKDEMLLKKGKSIEDLGSTELGRLIQGTKGKWSGASIQIPTNMYHTSRETTSFKAIRNYYKFLHDILIDNPIEFNIS